MPRIARKYLATPFLHLMVQGVNKEYIFYKKEYIEKYLELFKENSKKNNFTIIAYCMMNNHAHFLVYVEDIKEFSGAMHRINFLYAQMYNKKEKRVGVLFRNRYKLEPIYNIKYLVNCIKYIHNNPVKAKMVDKCADYEYSSYRDYMSNTGVTQSGIMKEMFGERCDYLELFKNSFEKKFMDMEKESKEEIRKYIMEGICEFKKIYCANLWEIFVNRNILKKTIIFLKEECGIEYKEIQDFLGISRKNVEALRKNND